MAEINNVIAEASQDLQTIEDFVNLPADSDVRPRLLPSVNVGTLAGTRDAIFRAGGLPAEPFATKALMTASSLANGKYAMVTDDTVNDGLYVKTAGAWVKSEYDPLSASKYRKNTALLGNYHLRDNDNALNYFVTADSVIGAFQTSNTVGNSPNTTYVIDEAVAYTKPISTVVSKFVSSTGRLVLCAFKLEGDDYIIEKEWSDYPLVVYKAGYNFWDVSNSGIELKAGQYLGFRFLGSSAGITIVSKAATTYVRAGITGNTVSKITSDKTTAWTPSLAVYSQSYLEVVIANSNYGGGGTPTIPDMSNADILLNYPQESLVYFTEVATPAIGEFVTDSTTSNTPNHTYVVAQAATVETVINTFASKNLSVSGYIVPCVFTQSGTNLVLKKAYTELPLAPYQVGYNFFDVSTNPITLEVGERLGYRIYGTTKSLLLVFPTDTSTVKTYTEFDLTSTTLNMSDTSKAVKTWLPAVGAFTESAAEVIKQGLPPAAGLKYTSFGDSITWYDKRVFSPSHIEKGKLAKGYQSYIVDSYGYTLDNQGVSSIDLTQISATKILPYDFADTYITTIMSGANDARKGVPVGTIAPIGSTFATNTYAGAMQKAIEHIISSNPKTIIVLITPIRGWYAEHSTSDVPNTDPNVVGVMSKGYPDMVKAIGDLYGLPVVDFYYELGWNDLNKNTYLGDNPALFTAYLLHPNNLGFKRMGKMLTNAFSQY